MKRDICRECGNSNLPCNACGGGPVFQSQARGSFAIAGEIQSPEPLGPDVKGGLFADCGLSADYDRTLNILSAGVMFGSAELTTGDELPSISNGRWSPAYTPHMKTPPSNPHGDAEIVFAKTAEDGQTFVGMDFGGEAQVASYGHNAGKSLDPSLNKCVRAYAQFAQQMAKVSAITGTIKPFSEDEKEALSRAGWFSSSAGAGMIETAKRSFDSPQRDKALDAFAKLAPADSGYNLSKMMADTVEMGKEVAE